MKKKYFFPATVAFILLGTTSFAQQNVGINEDGSQPNPHAILDIKSFTKGLLIPRVSTFGRSSIPNTKGLLVYDTTAGAFWYNTGIEWKSLAPDGSVWSLTGNKITDTSKFLGTTSNLPLLVKVNNQPAGRIDLDYPGNTFWGYNTGALIPPYNNTGTFFGTYNTAIGSLALSSNTTGGSNTVSGYSAMHANTSGFLNTANGDHALYSNTTGFNNTAGGANSLYNNTTGKWNTAYGANSLSSDSTGIENTTSGFQSMYYTSNGSYNTAGGAYALFANVTGSYNTAIGRNAAGVNTTGNYNTAVGYNAGGAGPTDNNNTAIGALAYVSTGLTNATAIGYNASVNASNKVRIGNSNVTVIEGQVPFTTPSDGRFKFQVQEDVKGLDFIMQLRPVTYQFDVKRFDAQQRQGNIIPASYDEATAIRRSGFIAQEVEKAADVSGYDFSGIIKPKTEQEHYSLSYESFVVPLVKGMQEQQKIINRQQQTITEQGQKIASLQENAARSEKQLEKLAELQQQVAELTQLIKPSK